MGLCEPQNPTRHHTPWILISRFCTFPKETAMVRELYGNRVVHLTHSACFREIVLIACHIFLCLLETCKFVSSLEYAFVLSGCPMSAIAPSIEHNRFHFHTVEVGSESPTATLPLQNCVVAINFLHLSTFLHGFAKQIQSEKNPYVPFFLR